MQYHEVKLNFTFASAAEMALNGVDTSYSPTATLYATYVFLDTDERRRYALVTKGRKAAIPRLLWTDLGHSCLQSMLQHIMQPLVEFHAIPQDHQSAGTPPKPSSTNHSPKGQWGTEQPL